MRLCLEESFLWHMSHEKRCWVVCVFKCCLRVLFWANFFSHIGQEKGFSLVCVLRCLLNRENALNSLSQ